MPKAVSSAMGNDAFTDRFALAAWTALSQVE